MGTVQRQSFTILAFDEYNKGNVDKARKLLDLAQEFFPAPNFPIDVYAVYIVTNSTRVDVVDLYKNIYGEAKARELWSAAYDHYSSEISYLAQFRGDKTAGVRGDLQGDLQIMSLLADIAARTLQDDALAAQAKEVVAPYNNSVY
jgi:hypothetical protein